MSQILFEKQDGIAWVTLNDPERLNAINEAMGSELLKLVPQINKDKSIRVVILTGAGTAFSAGGNLDMIVERTRKKAATNRKEMAGFYNKFLSVLKIEVPVIAMINGPAVGAAFCLALACDLRLASTTTRMGVNFVKLGLSPGMGSTFLIPQVLGIPTAMELLLTGKIINAEESLKKGIVHHLYAPEVLKEETLRLAQDIASNAPHAMLYAKKGILAQYAQLQKALQFEAQGQSVCFGTKDIQEGIEAIRSKRKPIFQGK